MSANEENLTTAAPLNRFAFDLYDRLREESGNQFLSPFSIAVCLAMGGAGARGETARQIFEALHLPADDERLHTALGDLIRRLSQEREGRAYRMEIADSFWGQTGYGFFDAYLDLIRTRYEGELHEVDFAQEPESARLEINRWVEEKTQGRIRDVMSPGMMHPLLRLVLVNAIYFKGAWAVPFEESSTQFAPFMTESGGYVEAAMMNRTGDVGYFEDDDVQAIDLPYQGISKSLSPYVQDLLSMTVFLPRKTDGLRAFEKSLDADRFMRALNGLERLEVELFLPKFRLESEFELGGTLRAMGIRDAFAMGTADFSGMADREDLAISEMIHKSFVDVNEAGTEAAAATMSGLLGRAVNFEAPPPVVFRADHPFLFLIREVETASILFLGRVDSP